MFSCLHYKKIFRILTRIDQGLKAKKPPSLTTSIQTAENDPFCPTKDNRIWTTTNSCSWLNSLVRFWTILSICIMSCLYSFANKKKLGFYTWLIILFIKKARLKSGIFGLLIILLNFDSHYIVNRKRESNTLSIRA